MDSRMPADAATSANAADFVRFCYRRKRVGWPELYDEMCAVGSRGLFRGWGVTELAEHGIGFTLFAMPALAALVTEVVDEEQANGPNRPAFSSGRLGTARTRGARQSAGPPSDDRDAQPGNVHALVAVGAR